MKIDFKAIIENAVESLLSEDKGEHHEFHKMANSILGSHDKKYDTHHEFSKSGMGADAGNNKLSKIHHNLLKHGFKEGTHTPHASADGSTVGSGEHYHHPDGHTAQVRSSLGVTKYNNRHSVTIKNGKHPDNKKG